MLPEASFVSRSEIRRRLVWGAVFAAAVIGGILTIIEPSDLAWTRGFMWAGSGNAIGTRPGIALGDHLQTAYYLWLWAHGLVSGHFPWTDPFQFALTGQTTLQVLGWPLVVLTMPVTAIAGPIAAYNAAVICGLLASAGCTYLLLRALDIPRPAAMVGGFAFAFAPFRLVQSGHTGAMLGFLLPLLLYTAERALRGRAAGRAWAWGCVATYLSVIASGELHFVMYGTVLFATFVVVRCFGVPRDRLRSLVLPAGVLLGAAAVLMTLIYGFVLSPSGRGGVAINAATYYAPRVANLLTRTKPSERYAYPGLAIAILAVAGLLTALRDASRRKAAVWAACVVAGSYVLAIAPSTRLFGLYKLIPFVGFVRVPGRILVLATVALAVLAGYGAAWMLRARRGVLAIVLVLAAIVMDAHGAAPGFKYTRAGANVLAAVPRGAPVLDLPPFPTDHHGASRYMLDLLRNPGPRVGGYDVLAPSSVQEAQRRSMSLTRVPVDPCDWRRAVDRFHFRYVAVHTDLFGVGALWPTAGPEPGYISGFRGTKIYAVSPGQLTGALDRTRGFHRVSDIDGTVVYRVGAAELACRGAPRR
jgi:hypothetical protein